MTPPWEHGERKRMFLKRRAFLSLNRMQTVNSPQFVFQKPKWHLQPDLDFSVSQKSDKNVLLHRIEYQIRADRLPGRAKPQMTPPPPRPPRISSAQTCSRARPRASRDWDSRGVRGWRRAAGALGAEPKGGRVPSPHCGCFGRSKISFFYAQKKVFFVIFFQKNARNPAKK